jgi:hypothetical protein
MTRNLVVHFRRLTYLVVPSPAALARPTRNSDPAGAPRAGGPLPAGPPATAANNTQRPPAPSRLDGGSFLQSEGDICTWEEWGHC